MVGGLHKMSLPKGTALGRLRTTALTVTVMCTSFPFFSKQSHGLALMSLGASSLEVGIWNSHSSLEAFSCEALDALELYVDQMARNSEIYQPLPTASWN